MPPVWALACERQRSQVRAIIEPAAPGKLRYIRLFRKSGWQQGLKLVGVGGRISEPNNSLPGSQSTVGASCSERVYDFSPAWHPSKHPRKWKQTT